MMGDIRIIGVNCSCGQLHPSFEDWQRCPFALTPRPVDMTQWFREQQEWHDMTPDDRPVLRITDVILQILLVAFVFPLMYLLIGMARIADYISRKKRRATP